MGNSQPSGSSTTTSETFFDEIDSSSERRTTHGTHISKDVLDHIQAKKNRRSMKQQPQTQKSSNIEEELKEKPISSVEDEKHYSIDDSYILKQIHVNEKTNKIISTIVDDEEATLGEMVNKQIKEFEEKIKHKDFSFMNKDIFSNITKDCLEEEEDLEDCLKRHGPRECGKLLKDYNTCSLKAKFNSMKNEI